MIRAQSLSDHRQLAQSFDLRQRSGMVPLKNLAARLGHTGFDQGKVTYALADILSAAPWQLTLHPLEGGCYAVDVDDLRRRANTLLHGDTA